MFTIVISITNKNSKNLKKRKYIKLQNIINNFTYILQNIQKKEFCYNQKDY